MALGLIFALAATVLNSVAGLMQSVATQRRTDRALVLDPRYLGGLVIDGLGWVCSVIALRYLPVFVVQSILGGAIALLAIGSRVLYGTRLRTIDRVALVGFLIGLGLIASSAGRSSLSSPSAAVVAGLVLAAGGLVAVLWLVWRTARPWVLGIIAGLGYGGTAVAVRALHTTDALSISDLVRQPAVYAVIVFCAVGLVAYPRALARGNVATVTAVLQVTEILVPGAVGIMLLGDVVRDGWWPVLGLGMVLALASVIWLTRSPATRPPRATALN